MSGPRYSEAFKERMVQKMTMPGGPCADHLAREVNVAGSTLGRWLKRAGMVGEMSKQKRAAQEKSSHKPPSTTADRPARSSRDWPPVEKLRVVAGAAQLKDDELGAYLRREGVHLGQLEEWRSDILAALGGPAPRASSGSEAKRVRELEREIHRKDKALAEVTALLVLEKKVQALFGTSVEEGDCMDERNEKK